MGYLTPVTNGTPLMYSIPAETSVEEEDKRRRMAVTFILEML